MSTSVNNSPRPSSKQRSSLVDFGRESVWSILSRFPTPDPMKARTKESRAKRGRPPPLSPRSLFPTREQTSLPYLVNHPDIIATSQTNSVISSMVASSGLPTSASPPHPHLSQSPHDDPQLQSRFSSSSSSSDEPLYDTYRSQSRWSADSDDDTDESSSPLSPSFLDSWNRIRTPVSPSPPRARPRRSSIIMNALSPRSVPWSTERAAANAQHTSPLRPLRYTSKNDDGSWKVVDTKGDVHTISCSDTKGVEGSIDKDTISAPAAPEKPRRNAVEDVVWQFRNWQGFQSKASSA